MATEIALEETVRWRRSGEQLYANDVRAPSKIFARGSVARASGDNTMEEIYENEESEAIYREAGGACAQGAAHQKVPSCANPGRVRARRGSRK